MKSQLIKVQDLRKDRDLKRVQVRCTDGYTKHCKHIFRMDRDEFESGKRIRCVACQEARDKEKSDLSMRNRFAARRV